MTGTFAWLETQKSAAVALSLVIEGTPTIYSTASMPGTYSADAAPYNQWADPVGGLVAGGALSQRIELYAQDLKSDSVSFRFVDAAGNLFGQLLREAYANGKKTFLSSSIGAGSTAAIAVKAMAAFAASGTIYCGGEAIAYTGVTTSGGNTSTFTGITRGKYSLNQTNGGAAFAPAHTIGNNVVASAVTAPSVTDYPRTWYGRCVHLFLHVKDPLTGVYNKPSEAVKLFTGHIESYGDDGDGGISITAKPAFELMHRQVGQEQWYAHLQEGRVIATTEDSLRLYSEVGNYAPVADLTTISTGASMGHDDVAEAMNAQFDSWRSGGSTDAGDLWGIYLVDFNDGGPMRYQIRLNANTVAVTTGRVEVSLNAAVWALLGWDLSTANHFRDTTSGDYMTPRSLVPKSGTGGAVWELTAPSPPVVFIPFGRTATTLNVSDEVGTFYAQSPTDIGPGTPADVNGVISIQGGALEGVFGVVYTAGSPSTIRLRTELDVQTGYFVVIAPGMATSSGSGRDEAWLDGAIRLGQVQEPPIARQAWYEIGPAGKLLLKALLSTGNSGYNHATYDVLPWGGVGVPASLIDVASWETLNEVEYQFLVTGPRPFYEYLEPILNVDNRYLVWRAASQSSNPKLGIVRPTFDSSAGALWQLTESNKTKPNERIKARRSVDGIVNRVEVKFAQGLDGQAAAGQVWIVEDIASQTDYGRRKTAKIAAPGVTNVADLAPITIGHALGYCARPLAIAPRSFNASLLRMAPGDSVALADNYMVDPATGTRGVVAVYGWVLGTKVDLATLQGSADLVFLPERAPRIMKWSPSAKVDETAGGGGYNAGTKTLTCKPHEFSPSYDVVDAARFVTGDKVHIVQVDAAVPLEWIDTVSGSAGNNISLVGGLTVPAFDSTKQYVIEADDILSVVTTQKTDKAFIADDADLTTGATPSTPYDWGSDGGRAWIGALGGSTTPDYTRGMFEPNSSYATKGEPVSVHKAHHLALAMASEYVYKTRGIYLNEAAFSVSQTGTTPRLVYLCWIPFYAHHSVSLIARIRGLAIGGGTATFKVYSCPSMPSGTSLTAYTFPAGTRSATFTTASATFVWSGELAITPALAPAAAGSQLLFGTWIAVEIFGSGGGISASLDSLSVYEGVLP